MLQATCHFCDAGGLYLNSRYCERCFRELNLLPPVYRKLPERICSDIVERVLVEEGLDPKVNIRIPELNLYPDLMVQVGPLLLIVEIDEKQHRRQIDRDQERTMRLKSKFSPLILVRINPDSYRGRGSMITQSKELSGKKVKKLVTFQRGEIELRENVIRNTIIGLVSQTKTDLCLGVKLPPFREILLFFDN